MAISDDCLVVGADHHDDGGSDAGAVYVFERSNAGQWEQVSKLTASDPNTGDEFGRIVVLRGDYLVAGAPAGGDGGDGPGAAYVFERSDAGQWEQASKLAADGAADDARFGASVAISGDYLVVGAYRDDAGAAYVFERSDAGQWEQISKLTASDAVSSGQFGASVAISGAHVVVGAPSEYGDHDPGTFAGAAYVFERSDAGPWEQAGKLRASDADYLGWFGCSAAMAGEYLVVGATGDDAGGDGAGAAYVFTRSDVGQWEQVRKLTAGDADAGAHFGVCVAAGNSHLVVGAAGKDSEAGACYSF